jgi:DNA-binding transcriptional LysR family regulator
MVSDTTWPAGMTGPDLRQMLSFVKVAELGGFTAAAAELHVAQQAVSQQVKTTKQMLGVTLLRRASRAVSPLRLARSSCARPSVCSMLSSAWSTAPGRRRGEHGPVRIAYTLTSAYETFPELQAALEDVLPGLDVRAREAACGSHRYPRCTDHPVARAATRASAY